MGKTIDLSGKRFGRWSVLKQTDPPQDWEHRGTWWLCQCDCGIKRPVYGNSLRSGTSRSCGCLHSEISSEQMSGKNHPMYRHGQAREGQRSKEWRTWNSMIRRCIYPSMKSYPHYGGRGIKICQRWLDSFEDFLIDVGYAPSEKHSLDRIDNNGNYEPGNVRWATNSEQIKNSRRARIITFQGRAQNIMDWAQEVGINRQTIQMRLDHYGWSIHDALTKPARR